MAVHSCDLNDVDRCSQTELLQPVLHELGFDVGCCDPIHDQYGAGLSGGPKTQPTRRLWTASPRPSAISRLAT